MLDPREIKLVLSSMSQHRAALMKSLENPAADTKQKEQYHGTVKQLDTLIKKLAVKVPTNKPKPPPQALNTVPPKGPAPKPEKRKIEFTAAQILIAEDNPDSATLLHSILEDMGLKNIEIAKDGREALTALEKCSPAYDLVLLDWDMPELSGVEVRQATRSLAKLRDTHFMMVTAISEAARIKEAIQQGIHDYIVKPVDAEILEKKIKVAMGHED